MWLLWQQIRRQWFCKQREWRGATPCVKLKFHPDVVEYACHMAYTIKEACRT
jgi:hypothetical protein